MSLPAGQPPLSVTHTPVAHELVVDKEKPEASQVSPPAWHTVSQEEVEEAAFFHTIVLLDRIAVLVVTAPSVASATDILCARGITRRVRAKAARLCNAQKSLTLLCVMMQVTWHTGSLTA